MVNCPKCKNALKLEVSSIDGVNYEYDTCSVCGWNNANIKKLEIINGLSTGNIKKAN